ncbi:gliding motility-associated ABC transporter substrate-binding protein GldG [Maribellus luteus]|uniref:gliding motility-associated ABC transporter substrate-binding protein GldG n=1 Tax=Maribellus luteus TaxID=2305463 RepID=UPI00138FC347|nr:gliding motility-associated ABC transporter substrate-binding protein GldG [Maribellus luteus]
MKASGKTFTLKLFAEVYSLFKKEIKTFLGSLIGYLAVLVFLLVSGLFLWVFPGDFNIVGSGYSTLDPFFSLAPWLYLFLIPAITMRFFADEKRSGTIELLLTRPVSAFQLVFAKFLAGMVLVFISLLPTLLYFLSVYLLGNPVGSIDTGATWGSFFGLFFLATIYVAIGVFTSSLTDNQIVSFILSMVLSFVFYLGFEFAASSGIPYWVEQMLTWLSINEHFLSASRGVIDLEDVIYFLGMTFLFLFFTAVFLRKGNVKRKIIRTRLVLVTLAVLVVFFASSSFLLRIDLTVDKRYSLSPISKQIAAEIQEPVSVEFFLEGELEPGLKKLQREVFEKVAVLNAYSSKPIRIKVTDIYQVVNPEKREEKIQELYEKGIKPTSFRHKTETGVATKLIIPGALIQIGGKEVAVNFLKSNQDFSGEYNINHSVESVEFELVNAFQKLMRGKKSTVAFLEGHGELDQYQVMDFANALSGDFEVTRVNTTLLGKYADNFDILVIAGPDQPFSEPDKYIIDQYIMNGGKVVWLIDPVKVDVDSLSRGFRTFAFPHDINLGDQLFKYGARLNYELLQDVNCSQLAVNTAPAGAQPKYTLHPWYYSPLLTPNDNHPLSRNLNRVFAEYVSSVDTVSGTPGLTKTVILSTSPYARRVKSPSSVSLQNIDNPPARELFNTPFIPVGVLMEGTFTSLYKNRMVEQWGFSSASTLNESQPSKMVVFADAGMIANLVNYSGERPQISEMGYDKVTRRAWGNKEFLMNTLFYLNDDRGIMQLRNRTIKLRLLDQVKLREQKAFWQWLNVLLPALVMALFGLVYNLVRKYRYTRS